MTVVAVIALTVGFIIGWSHRHQIEQIEDEFLHEVGR